MNAAKSNAAVGIRIIPSSYEDMASADQCQKGARLATVGLGASRVPAGVRGNPKRLQSPAAALIFLLLLHSLPIFVK
jgi:hypothetical protein